MPRRERNPPARTFIHRAGTRIAGTVIACDATGGGDLLFLSHGRTYASPRAGDRRAPPRAPRAQILTTAETLALMGPAGERLRARALILGYGRPFTLGSLRIELLPSGHLPGAAALACETDGRRILYAGAARLGAPAWGAVPGAVRAADALCIDASFGHPRFAFLARDDAGDAARRFVRSSREAGCTPVLLCAAYGPAQDLAAALAADGWRLRGHRSTVDAAAAYRRAGADGPGIARFAGSLARDEVLLWPTGGRHAGQLGRLGPLRVAWASGWAADADANRRLGVDTPIPYSGHADFAGLLAYVEASGAREIATTHGFAEDFAATLRKRGIDAYRIGPPRQIALFADQE